MYNEYYELEKKYQKEYGPKTIILFENGKFYELFSKESNPIFLKKVCEDLNLTLTRKSKEKRDSPFSDNPHMAGIPVPHSDKYIDILQKYKYNIVVVEQKGPGKSSKFYREVSHIITPGTILKHRNVNSNYLMNIYISNGFDKYDKEYLYYSVSVIEVSTGKIYLYEDKNVYNFIHSHFPSEILFYNTTNIYLEDIINDLNLHNISYQEFKDFDKKILLNSYENQFFEKVYNIKSELESTDYLGIALYKNSITSLILLLDYISKLMPTLLKNIDIPIIWTNENVLELRNNTLYQLNIVSNNSIQSSSSVESLLDIICKTNTAMGTREFKNQILNPLINVDELNNIYDFVDILKENYEDLQNELKNILDIERNHRKLILGIITPSEFGKLDESYKCILNIFEIIIEKYKINFEKIICKDIIQLQNFMKDFYSDYINTYDTYEMKRYSISDTSINIFQKNIYEDIDDIVNQIKDNKEYFTEIKNELIQLCKNKDKTFDIKLENTKDGYYLSITDKRSITLKKIIEKNNKFSDLKIVKKNSVKKITSIQLENFSNNLILLNEKLSKLIKIRFNQSIQKYSNDYYYKNLKDICEIVTKIDLYNSYGKVAIKNNYCKPIISNNFNKSYLKCNELRHPIIEKINTRVDYITNDVELSGDKEDGKLIFGPNATGKSCLMKAIGISIIMAQCGMFVPCSQMIYYPYKTLFTRILGSDNIFKGQSSFAVEMIEIKTILDYSDENSLILGDEICRGTEDLSALSLVASLVENLSEKKSSFVMTTHLHKLPLLENISSLNNVKSFHLTIKIENEKVIYLRKIEEGPGDNKYGIEIAKHIVHNDSFILKSIEIRNNILNEPNKLLNTKSSNYNSNIFIHKCMIPECNNMAVDTHHIKHQEKADSNKYIGHIPMNNESNLIPLCKNHHDDAHNDKLDIYGYIQTSNGILLDYKYNNKCEIINSRKKYSQEQIDSYLKFISDKCDNILNGNTVNEIKKEFNIKISKNTLQKMIDKNYF